MVTSSAYTTTRDCQCSVRMCQMIPGGYQIGIALVKSMKIDPIVRPSLYNAQYEFKTLFLLYKYNVSIILASICGRIIVYKIFLVMW